MIHSCKKPPVYFESTTGSFYSQYAGLPLKSHKVNIDSVSGVSAINIGSDAKYAGFINFNQLVQNGNFVNGATNWTPMNGNFGSISASDNECTYTFTAVANNNYTNSIKQAMNEYTNHVCFCSYDIYVSKASTALNYYFDSAWKTNIPVGWSHMSGVKKLNSDITAVYFGLTNCSDNGYEVGDTYKIKNVNVIDLTAMFGSTKADEIYQMEQQTAGSGVAYFRSLFPNNYYAYNAGTLTTVSAVNGSTNSFFTIPIGQTVNEGEYDARTGILEVTLPSVQTIQLPPCLIDTLQGENNVWADTGNTTLEYLKAGR